MITYKIPNLKEILKPRWSHNPGEGVNQKGWHKQETRQQSSAPEDSNLLRKLGIKKREKVLAIAGYYASWASEIARLGAKVDYSDISSSMVKWAKRKYGKLFGKYLCSNYELIPKNTNEYDWTFTFEACGGGSGLPIAYLRSLLNKKGGILVLHMRYGEARKKMGGKPRTYPLIIKTLSKVYGAKYKIKGIKIRSHRFNKPMKMISHKIFIVKTNEKARNLAKQDLDALSSNKFNPESLKRFNHFSKAIAEEYIKFLKN